MLAMLSHKIKHQTITVRKINQKSYVLCDAIFKTHQHLMARRQWQNAYKILLLSMIFD